MNLNRGGSARRKLEIGERLNREREEEREREIVTAKKRKVEVHVVHKVFLI